MLGLFHHCPCAPAPPNAPSMGGRCCPNPACPIPDPHGPCALARPPAIRTPATAKAKRAIFTLFIDHSSPCVARATLLVFSFACPDFLLRSIVVHQLRQRLHRRRNRPRNIAVHGCQQIRVLRFCAIHSGIGGGAGFSSRS